MSTIKPIKQTGEYLLQEFSVQSRGLLFIRVLLNQKEERNTGEQGGKKDGGDHGYIKVEI